MIVRQSSDDKNTLNNGWVAVTGSSRASEFIYMCSDWFGAFQNIDMLSPVHANHHISHSPWVNKNEWAFTAWDPQSQTQGVLHSKVAHTCTQHPHGIIVSHTQHRAGTSVLWYLCFIFFWYCLTEINDMQYLEHCHTCSGENVNGIACCHRITASCCCWNAKLKPRHLWKINVKSKPRCLF